MTVEAHGGFCCGVSHVCEFPSRADARWLDREVKQAIEYVEEGRREYFEDIGRTVNWKEGKFGHLIEVCLTDNQMVEWAQTLKEYGFRLGPRWLNDNSGNYVNLLTYQPKIARGRRPYNW